VYVYHASRGITIKQQKRKRTTERDVWAGFCAVFLCFLLFEFTKKSRDVCVCVCVCVF